MIDKRTGFPDRQTFMLLSRVRPESNSLEDTILKRSGLPRFTLHDSTFSEKRAEWYQMGRDGLFCYYMIRFEKKVKKLDSAILDDSIFRSVIKGDIRIPRITSIYHTKLGPYFTPDAPGIFGDTLYGDDCILKFSLNHTVIKKERKLLRVINRPKTTERTLYLMPFYTREKIMFGDSPMKEYKIGKFTFK